MRKSFILLIIIVLFSFHSFGQKPEKRSGYKFSPQEEAELLQFRSKQQKIKGLVALASGPLITATGIYIHNQSSNKTANDLGSIVTAAGIITTLSSIPFFISSGRLKRQAQILLKNESVSFYRVSNNSGLVCLSISISL